MNRRFLSFIFGSALIAAHICADTFDGPTALSDRQFGNLIINGPAQLNNVKAVSLTVNGPLQFSQLEVSKTSQVVGPITNSEKGNFKQLNVKGPLAAGSVQCDGLAVFGPANVRDWMVKGRTVIVGPLIAKNSTFSDVEITADKVVFENTTVNNILIKQQVDNKIQELSLKGSTIVNGNITFESGNGKVTTGKMVEIRGSVKGAKNPTTK